MRVGCLQQSAIFEFSEHTYITFSKDYTVLGYWNYVKLFFNCVLYEPCIFLNCSFSKEIFVFLADFFFLVSTDFEQSMQNYLVLTSCGLTFLPLLIQQPFDCTRIGEVRLRSLVTLPTRQLHTYSWAFMFIQELLSEETLKVIWFIYWIFLELNVAFLFSCGHD